MNGIYPDVSSHLRESYYYIIFGVLAQTIYARMNK
jgi:hypothetical protein